MTTETDLLPSSVAAFTEALWGESGSLDAWLEVNDESEVAAHVEAYASACVSSATAEKDAEIDALRTRLEDTVRDSTNKIEALRADVDLRDSVIATHAADTREYQKRISQAEARAERLAEEVEALRAEVERLRADLMESDEIREKLGHLLTRTAAALKGEPPAGVWHSWHDLPERAERLAEALRRYGVHDQACVAANIPICTCGLDAALEQESNDA